MTKEKVRKITSTENLAFVLDKYIPFNKSLKEPIANLVMSSITPSLFIQINGQFSLIYAPQYTSNKLSKEILKLQLMVNNHTFFLLGTEEDNIFDTAMAMDILLDVGVKSWLFALYASSIKYAKVLNIDIVLSKEEYRDLHTKLSKNPIEYFETLEIKLSDNDKKANEK